MQTFNYTPGNPLRSKLSTLGIALLMIVFPLIAPFGIRIGRVRILGPTAVTIIFVVGGIALLIFTLLELRRQRILASRKGTITVDGDRVTYPEVEKGEVVEKEFSIKQIEKIEFDEEDRVLTVYTPYSIDIHADFFESDEAYDTFRALLGK